MTISGFEFIHVEFDFEGKDSLEERQCHVEEISQVLQTEYQEEIEIRGGAVEFFYTARSRVDQMRFSPTEMNHFDIKLQAARFIKKKKNDDQLQEQQ